ncbi:hypothetical protein Tco_1384758 [Tanacetum coccineum]
MRAFFKPAEFEETGEAEEECLEARRMFGSEFIMIVEPGAKLVNGMGNNLIFLLNLHGVRWQVQLGRVVPYRVVVIGAGWSDFGCRNVDQDNLPLQLEKRVYPPSGSQTVDLVLNHRKYKILVGNVPLENSQNILEMYLYGDEWWKMMKELDFHPPPESLLAFTFCCTEGCSNLRFNESGRVCYGK